MSNELNVRFYQRMTIVAPYTSEQDEELIRAKWASMCKKSNYDEINTILESIAEKNNIKILGKYIK